MKFVLGIDEKRYEVDSSRLDVLGCLLALSIIILFVVTLALIVKGM